MAVQAVSEPGLKLLSLATENGHEARKLELNSSTTWSWYARPGPLRGFTVPRSLAAEAGARSPSWEGPTQARPSRGSPAVIARQPAANRISSRARHRVPATLAFDESGNDGS